MGKRRIDHLAEEVINIAVVLCDTLQELIEVLYKASYLYDNSVS